MAEEAEKTEASAPSSAQGGGGMSMGVFIGVSVFLAVLLLGGGFALAFFVLPGQVASVIETQNEMMLTELSMKQEGGAAGGAAEAPPAEAPQEEHGGHGAEGGHGGEHAPPPEEGHGAEGGHGGGGGHGAAGGSAESGQYAAAEEFVLSDIIVNLAGSRGGRYVQASLFFDGPKTVLGELEAQRPKVVDLVSEVLSSKTLDHFNAPGIRGELRREIIAAINAMLSRGKLENVYFEKLIVQ